MKAALAFEDNRIVQLDKAHGTRRSRSQHINVSRHNHLKSNVHQSYA